MDKKKARLNCIHHLLRQMPYQAIERPEVVLPERVRHADYIRQPVPPQMMVPEVYEPAAAYASAAGSGKVLATECATPLPGAALVQAHKALHPGGQVP